ncbi:MAG TPA: hypothetical protein VN420_01515 [Candidatus Fimivivens sp.]|nr:hypothetical protein [Candidatus Fimivivens sp.]
MKNVIEMTSGLQEKPEKERFLQAEKYISDQSVRLENGYSLDGTHAASCASMAVDVARLVCSEGGMPSILLIEGEKVDSINTATLKPVRYKGTVSWGGHVACECDGTLYDPLVGTPMKEHEYLRSVFSDPVASEVLISSDEMEGFLLNASKSMKHASDAPSAENDTN